MATDYDAPRKTDDEIAADSIEELKARRSDKTSGVVDEDEAEAAESFELPGADLSGEELSVRVLPPQQDEFTCMSCFLVHHRSQLAAWHKDQPICSECAASVALGPHAGRAMTYVEVLVSTTEPDVPASRATRTRATQARTSPRASPSRSRRGSGPRSARD